MQLGAQLALPANVVTANAICCIVLRQCVLLALFSLLAGMEYALELQWSGSLGLGGIRRSVVARFVVLLIADQ